MLLCLHSLKLCEIEILKYNVIFLFTQNHFKRTGTDPCFLNWKSTFLLIGGKINPRLVQVYDLLNETWTSRNSSVPMDVHNSACVVLPNEDVLVIFSFIVKILIH